MTKTLRLLLSWTLSAALAAGAAAPALAKVEGDTIVLGATVSETGRYKTNGMHMRNGYDLAAERINAMGGVTVNGKAYKFRMIYYDDQSKLDRAALLTEQLIVQDGVKYLLGPYGSALTGAVAPVVEKHAVPMIEANGAASSLFTKGYRYLFAVLTSADQYLTSAVDLLAEQSHLLYGKSPDEMRLALAFENDPFSRDVRSGVTAAAARHGMRIVINDTLPKRLNDMTTTLTKVRVLRPDALFVSGHVPGALTAAKQIEQFKVDVPLIAMTHCDAARIERKLPAGAEYALCARQWQKQLTYEDDDGVFGGGDDFVRLFEEKYDYDPPYQAAESAAAVQLWADVFRRAQSFDPEVLRDAIAESEMQTFYGNIKFNAAGQNIAKPMVMSQILKSDYHVVAPTRWASTEAVFPRPRWRARCDWRDDC